MTGWQVERLRELDHPYICKTLDAFEEQVGAVDRDGATKWIYKEISKNMYKDE